MQGQYPTGYAQTSTQTARDTTQNVNRDWTCQRWFNNIANKVTAKTHQYFGKFVAAAMLPFTFIPSLACDLFYGAKSLYQRTVSKAPVLNHVSTGSTSSSTSESNTSPTIDQLRQKFPVLDDYITTRDAADSDTRNRLSGLSNLCQKFEQDLEIATQEKKNQIDILNKKLADCEYVHICQVNLNQGYKQNIKELELIIDNLTNENNHLKDCLRQFQDTNPSPGLNHTEGELLKTSDELNTSTSINSRPAPIIIVEEIDDFTARKDTQTDSIDSVSTKESTADNSGAVANGGTESSATEANRNDASETSSDESFETIPLPLSNTQKATPTTQPPESVEPSNPQSPTPQNNPHVD